MKRHLLFYFLLLILLCSGCINYKKLKFDGPIENEVNIEVSTTEFSKNNEEQVLELNFINNTEEAVFFGADFCILRKSKNGWEYLERQDGYGWPDILYMLEPGESMQYDAELFNNYYDLAKGDYLFKLECYNNQKKTIGFIFAEFRIE